MNDNAPLAPDQALFKSLTTKQREVLDFLADSRTTKEIAGEIGVSDSAVNQRIEPLRQRLGGVPRAELTRRYRAWREARATLIGEDDCKSLTGKISHLPIAPQPVQQSRPADAPGRFHFADAATFEQGAPWHWESEGSVVPRLLDGKHAGWFRVLAILAMSTLIVAALVLALTAAQVLTETYGEGPPGTETSR